MSLHKAGGFSALTCACTYLFGFGYLIIVLAPFGYGTTAIDTAAVVGFVLERPGSLILFNSVIYLVNAFALVVLVTALAAMLKAAMPHWASVTHAIGLIWAALVLGAGMIGNVAVEQAAHLAETDLAGAARLWHTLHSVELGLGGGNEIAGGIWITCASLGGYAGRALGRFTTGLGLLTGLGGVLTLIPYLGDMAGAIFGLGAIVWFVAVGITLLLNPELSSSSQEEVKYDPA